MKSFDTEVKSIFLSMGLIPRPHQLVAINLILTEFFVNNKKNVILCADTGTGKSIIAAVVAKYFKTRVNNPLNSIILMGTNSLVEQYSDSFSNYSEDEFFQVKGSSKYPCKAGIALMNSAATADSCFKSKLDTSSPLLSKCNSCEYKHSRRKMNETENLITNYSYYFISKMWSKVLQDRSLTVFDEAHTLNEVFCEHNSILVTVDRLNSYIKEIEKDMFENINKKGISDTIKFFKNLVGLISNKKINKTNYLNVLQTLYGSYKILKEEYTILASAFKGEMTKQLQTEKVAKKYYDLGCKIGDLLSYNYDHVLDVSEDKLEFSVKPLFIGNMAKVILGERNLFMSATITEELISNTLDIDKNTIAYIKLDPVFDKENKPVVMYPIGKMNYASSKDIKVQNKITKSANDICNLHNKESGLILSPSFYMSDMIAKNIKSHKVFLHERGQNLSDIISDFKSYKKPAVLISPSLYEGLDFPSDSSRFQIIVKAPYPSLGDKRIKEICDKHPKIYRQITLMKIIQGIGRSIRSSDDFAVSYMLDENAISLFKSKENIWLNQFTVINK